MTLATLARRTQQVVKDNSPAILTGTAIAGTIVSTVLGARAGFRAGYRVAEEELTNPAPADAPKPSNKEVFKKRAKMTWKLYLPSAVTGVGTIASIATANRISMGRTAAMATAYTLADKAFTEYQEKVKDVIGEKKEQTEIRDKIMQDRVTASGDKASMIILGGGDVLCYDSFTDRYFMSSMEKLKKAQNDVNYEILHSMYVSLSEFYDKIGLPHTKFSDEVGWNTDNLCELHFSSVMTPDDKPALGYSFHVDPVRGYYKTHG